MKKSYLKILILILLNLLFIGGIYLAYQKIEEARAIKNYNQQFSKAIQEEEAVEKEGFEVRSIEGKDGGKWILMDLNDVIVHVFYYADREFYNLEKLWSDAPIVNIVSEN